MHIYIQTYIQLHTLSTRCSNCILCFRFFTLQRTFRKSRAMISSAVTQLDLLIRAQENVQHHVKHNSIEFSKGTTIFQDLLDK